MRQVVFGASLLLAAATGCSPSEDWSVAAPSEVRYPDAFGAIVAVELDPDDGDLMRTGRLSFTLDSGETLEVPPGTPFRGTSCYPLTPWSDGQNTPCYVQVGLTDEATAAWITALGTADRITDRTSISAPQYHEVTLSGTFFELATGHLVDTQGNAVPIEPDASAECIDAVEVRDVAPGSSYRVELDRDGRGHRFGCLYSD
jgi:hypothetical protein